MDRRMHALWLTAERRIDAALAGIAVAVSWEILVSLTVLLTPVHWTPGLQTGILAAFPAIVLMVRPLRDSLRVARAIEERDVEERERWLDAGVPPRHHEFVIERQSRMHYPLLGVLALACVAAIVISRLGMMYAASPAAGTFSLGLIVSSFGALLLVAVISGSSRLRPRTLLGGILAVGWMIPTGGAIASYAVISGRRVLEETLAERTLTTASFVIFGIIGMLVAVVLLAAWVAGVSMWWTGRGLGSRPVAMVAEEGLRTEEPEFDEDDVARIEDAMSVAAVDRWIAVVTVAATLAIVLAAVLGGAGTLVHGILGLLAAAGVAAGIYRLMTS